MTNPVGRPLKYKTVEEFLTKDTPWVRESDLVDFIETNIELFVSDSLNSNYITHKREWFFQDSRPFGANKPRIDLMIETDGGRVGVECKLPKQTFAELSRAISQLLAYSVMADNHKNSLDRLVLVTTQYNPIVSGIIQKYELPIDLIIMGRHQRLESFHEN